MKFWILTSLIILSFSACKKQEILPPAAVLLDEVTLPEVPVDALVFQWEGDTDIPQKLLMWRTDLDILPDNTTQIPNAPDVYNITFGINYPAFFKEVFRYQNTNWIPLQGVQYSWRIDLMYPEGIVSSEVRTFIPNP